MNLFNIKQIIRKVFRIIQSLLYWFTQVKVIKYLWYGRKIWIYRKAHIKLHRTSQLLIKKKNSLRLGGPWEPIGNNFYPAFFDTHFVAYKNTYVEISGKVRVQTGCLFRIQENARLILGENILFNSFGMIYCYEMIKVGDDVVIGPYVKIRDSDSHHFEYPGYEKKTTAPIIIENHVWIGLNVTILKGVTIGEGAVIAAGSVVTKNVPPHCLAGGNPVKVLRENVIWR